MILRQNTWLDMRYVRQFAQGVGTTLVLLVLSTSPVLAETSSSANYRVDQTFFGSGGELNACSGSYCSKQTAGELGVGNTSSSNYQAYAGFNTTDDPYIEFVVTGNNIDLGYLDTASTKTATGTFYVRAWQASGYIVRTASDPPTNTGPSQYQMTALATPTGPSPGTEQFGINLVDNSSPNIGANPQQSQSFSYGTASTGYDTANLFKYVKGDAVAESAQSTGVTTYTVSYIFNIANATPSGAYQFRHVLVATGTF